jgi:hypothetical protein
MLNKFKEHNAQEQNIQSNQLLPKDTEWAGEIVQDWNRWMSGGVITQFDEQLEYCPLDMLDVLNSQMPG